MSEITLEHNLAQELHLSDLLIERSPRHRWITPIEFDRSRYVVQGRDRQQAVPVEHPLALLELVPYVTSRRVAIRADSSIVRRGCIRCGIGRRGGVRALGIAVGFSRCLGGGSRIGGRGGRLNLGIGRGRTQRLRYRPDGRLLAEERDRNRNLRRETAAPVNGLHSAHPSL